MKERPELLFFMHTFSARIVGGAVRNTLLDLPITGEIDLATPFTPNEMMYIADIMRLKHIPTGIDHGTITVLGRHYTTSYLHYIEEILTRIESEKHTNQPESAIQLAIENACKYLIANFTLIQSFNLDTEQASVYEFTTLRDDIETDGRHAKIAFTKDWKTDAERRDFTINALYADTNGHVYDLINGIQDIHKQYIRFVGTPSLRIQEDYLRILRFFRFNAHYGSNDINKWDADGLEACRQNAQGLKQISQERIFAELYKMFKGKYALTAIHLMDKCHIINTLNWPNINTAKIHNLTCSLQQYSLQIEQNNKWKALLSEVVFATFDGDWSSLKMPKKTLQIIQSLQQLQCAQIADWYKAFYKYGIEWIYAKILLENISTPINTLTSNTSSHHDNNHSHWLYDLEKLELSKSTGSFAFPITGKDIIDTAKCEPGPLVGQIHSKILNWWLEELCKPNHEECMKYMLQIITNLN